MCGRDISQTQQESQDKTVVMFLNAESTKGEKTSLLDAHRAGIKSL